MHTAEGFLSLLLDGYLAADVELLEGVDVEDLNAGVATRGNLGTVRAESHTAHHALVWHGKPSGEGPAAHKRTNIMHADAGRYVTSWATLRWEGSSPRTPTDKNGSALVNTDTRHTNTHTRPGEGMKKLKFTQTTRARRKMRADTTHAQVYTNLEI